LADLLLDLARDLFVLTQTIREIPINAIPYSGLVSTDPTGKVVWVCNNSNNCQWISQTAFDDVYFANNPNVQRNSDRSIYIKGDGGIFHREGSFTQGPYDDAISRFQAQDLA
jgi:hypothetical protein